jgi:hypothetical protein
MAFLRARRLAALCALLVGGACYDTGDGTAPPANQFYFPVGLKVSHGGTVLYAVNADFDLQYNGGTIQSYDLSLIRRHAVLAIQDPANKVLPLVRTGVEGACPANPPVFRVGQPGERQPLGETCAPPVNSQFYFRDAVVIGAFATDLLMSPIPSDLAVLSPKIHADDPLPAAGTTGFDRLFVPVRGSATLTWADVPRDNFDSAPNDGDNSTVYAPYKVACGQDGAGRCDHAHAVGEDINEPGNSRHILLPGEPFGATISQDGTSIVMTHQDDTKSSLFLTGLDRTGKTDLPSLQFVADGAPLGGMGVAAIPHDPDAFLGAKTLPLPAYLESSRSVAQVTLLRQYSDEFGGSGASIPRPFITIEKAFPVSASAGATDSRGIAIDDTPHRACKAKVTSTDPAERDKQIAACAKKPARVFIANRTPAALLVGDLGGNDPVGNDGTSAYDPDRLTIHTSIPLSAGPSQVYLAPIVDKDGAYALRVFAVCFDSAQIFVYDPDEGVLENVIKVGIGPFAMAFDPFNMDDVAQHKQVPTDPRGINPDPSLTLRRYRFGYVSSFTQSYVQLLDLDNAAPNADPAIPLVPRPTFEKMVFILGLPTNPKGS